MDLSADELAGIAELFGALARDELQAAAAELAFKRDGEFEPDAFADDVDAAVRSYHLLAVDADAVSIQGDGTAPPPAEYGADATDGADADRCEQYLVAGPIAFPQLPDDAGDLPHILDVPERSVDQDAAGRAAEERFRRDAATAAEDGDADRIAELLDVSYELEAWGPVDLDSARTHLDAVTD